MIQHLHSSAHRDILERYYHKTILTAMLAYVRKEAEGLDVSESKVVALARFYTAALAGLSIEWLEELGWERDSIVSVTCSTAISAARLSAAARTQRSRITKNRQDDTVILPVFVRAGRTNLTDLLLSSSVHFSEYML